jgi:hypothetical protein
MNFRVRFIRPKPSGEGPHSTHQKVVSLLYEFRSQHKNSLLPCIHYETKKSMTPITTTSTQPATTNKVFINEGDVDDAFLLHLRLQP